MGRGGGGVKIGHFVLTHYVDVWGGGSARRRRICFLDFTHFLGCFFFTWNSYAIWGGKKLVFCVDGVDEFCGGVKIWHFVLTSLKYDPLPKLSNYSAPLFILPPCLFFSREQILEIYKFPPTIKPKKNNRRRDPTNVFNFFVRKKKARGRNKQGE